MSWRAGIHGYAAQWDVVTSPLLRPNAPHLSSRARFERECFVYDPAKIEIWFMHNHAKSYGRGDQLDLEIWSDAYGLAFAFRPPTNAWSLACGVADGRYDNCSVGIDIYESTVERDGVQSIGFAVLKEISICPRGACPGAICWNVQNGPMAIRPAAQALLPTWERGRAAAASSLASLGRR